MLLKKTTHLKKASSFSETLISITVICLLIAGWFYSIDVNKQLKKATIIVDESYVGSLQTAVLAYETIEKQSIFPSNTESGFYTICKSNTPKCDINDKYINLNILVEKKYLPEIPTHSIYSNEISSGYVIRHNQQSQPVILTYGDLKIIAKKNK